jgi:neutral amino acid transport system ATP-binding protein
MSPALLEVAGLDKHFGGVAAVRDASFAVTEGSITALIGPNGAGKTTMFNLVSGFLRPDRGTVRFAGQHQPGERLVTTLLAPGRVARREREVRQRAEELLRLVRLSHLAGDYAGTLSGGQRKLLELGRALMVEPRMILLDEPMAGVAPVLGEQLLDHIRELRERRGVTVLVIEHDMDVVMTISDRVIVMDEGHVIAEGPPDAIQRDERVIEAYLGRLSAPGGGAAR